MAEVRNNDPSENQSWKDRCIKLLEEVAEKSSAVEDAQGKTRNLLEEKKELQNNLKLIEEEIEKASKQLKEMGNDEVDKPVCGSLLKLYGLITKLTFDIETNENEPKGYVAGNSVETFQFNTAEHSQQFIIDSLWSLIEAQLKSNQEVG